MANVAAKKYNTISYSISKKVMAVKLEVGVRAYKIVRVAFGVTFSLYLALKTVQQLVKYEKNKYPVPQISLTGSLI